MNDVSSNINQHISTCALHPVKPVAKLSLQNVCFGTKAPEGHYTKIHTRSEYCSPWRVVQCCIRTQ